MTQILYPYICDVVNGCKIKERHLRYNDKYVAYDTSKRKANSKMTDIQKGYVKAKTNIIYKQAPALVTAWVAWLHLSYRVGISQQESCRTFTVLLL